MASAGKLAESEFKKVWGEEEHFKFQRRLTDPTLGEVSLFKNPQTNQMVVIKERVTTSKADAEKNIQDLKARLALGGPNNLRMLDYSSSVSSELCSTNYVTRGVFEFIPLNLQTDIENRRRANADFSAEDLLAVTSQTLSGLGALHSKGVHHGDVRPQTVGIDRAQAKIKLIDRLADSTPLEKIQQNNIVAKKALYISPQLYHKLMKDKKAPCDPQKNDLFALGLTVLAAGVQEPTADLYSPAKGFDSEKLAAQLAKFSDKYASSLPLLNIVHNLLAESEDKRSASWARLNAPAAQSPVVAAPKPDEAQALANNSSQVKTTYSPLAQSSLGPTTTTTSYISSGTPTFTQGQTYTTTYTQAQPITTNYSQPTANTTYTQAQPITTYIQAQPTTTTYTQPTTTTYTQPTTYTSSTPGTIPVRTEYVTSNGPVRTEYISANIPTTTQYLTAPIKHEYISAPPIRAEFIGGGGNVTHQEYVTTTTSHYVPSGVSYPTSYVSYPGVTYTQEPYTVVGEASTVLPKSFNSSYTTPVSQPSTVTYVSTPYSPIHTEERHKSMSFLNASEFGKPFKSSYTNTTTLPATTTTYAQPIKTTTYVVGQPLEGEYRKGSPIPPDSTTAEPEIRKSAAVFDGNALTQTDTVPAVEEEVRSEPVTHSEPAEEAQAQDVNTLLDSQPAEQA